VVVHPRWKIVLDDEEKMTGRKEVRKELYKPIKTPINPLVI